MNGGAILALAGAIVFHAEVPVEGPVVRLGGVADLSAVPEALRERAAALPLMTLASDRRRTSIDRAELVSRARALMPALASLLPAGNAPIILRRHDTMPTLAVAHGLDPAGIAKGETVMVSVANGPVRIEFAGKALQNGEPGGRLFVLTPDRAVLSAECCGD